MYIVLNLLATNKLFPPSRHIIPTKLCIQVELRSA